MKAWAWMAVGALCAGAGAGVAGAAAIDALAATVGPRQIMLSDIRLARELHRAPQGPDEVVLTHLVNRALMLAEVVRFQQPNPPEVAVNEALAAVRQAVGDAGWAALLRRNGVDAAYVRAYVSDDLRLETYLRQRFTALSEPGEDELRLTYDARQQARPDPAATFDAMRPQLARELSASRFTALVEQWLVELRVRGEVSIRGIPADAVSGIARD